MLKCALACMKGFRNFAWSSDWRDLERNSTGVYKRRLRQGLRPLDRPKTIEASPTTNGGRCSVRSIGFSSIDSDFNRLNGNESFTENRE